MDGAILIKWTFSYFLTGNGILSKGRHSQSEGSQRGKSLLDNWGVWPFAFDNFFSVAVGVFSFLIQDIENIWLPHPCTRAVSVFLSHAYLLILSIKFGLSNFMSSQESKGACLCWFWAWKIPVIKESQLLFSCIAPRSAKSGYGHCSR